LNRAHGPGPAAIPQYTHDNHDDERVADQDEQREHQRFHYLDAQQSEVQLSPQVKKEKQQQEVAQA